MLVHGEDEPPRRVPLDDIAVLICNAHRLTYSNTLFARLAERGAVVVLCGSNHAPVAWVLPVVGNYEQTGRMRAQVAAGEAVKRRAWQHLVRAKLLNQAVVLEATGADGAALAAMATRVRPGDPDNLEGLGAQRYWPALFGKGFRRDPDGEGINALLNWGYAVLRSATARATVGAGLHPSLGIHHHSAVNPMCLVDDLMEPFRHFVDLAVKRLAEAAPTALDKTAKARLVSTLYVDLRLGGEISPLLVCLERLAVSLARSFVSGRVRLTLPDPPAPLDLSAVGRETC